MMTLLLSGQPKGKIREATSHHLDVINCIPFLSRRGETPSTQLIFVMKLGVGVCMAAHRVANYKFILSYLLQQNLIIHILPKNR
jgi:hypothetical protein